MPMSLLRCHPMSIEFQSSEEEIPNHRLSSPQLAISLCSVFIRFHLVLLPSHYFLCSSCPMHVITPTSAKEEPQLSNKSTRTEKTRLENLCLQHNKSEFRFEEQSVEIEKELPVVYFYHHQWHSLCGNQRRTPVRPSVVVGDDHTLIVPRMYSFCGGKLTHRVTDDT